MTWTQRMLKILQRKQSRLLSKSRWNEQIPRYYKAIDYLFQRLEREQKIY